jgi:hypothetical protein
MHRPTIAPALGLRAWNLARWLVEQTPLYGRLP